MRCSALALCAALLAPALAVAQAAGAPPGAGPAAAAARSPAAAAAPAPAAAVPPAAAAPAATPAQAASAVEPAAPHEAVAEPNVKRSVIEDDANRVEELRVRGQVKSITVTTKGALAGRYEIHVGDPSREMSAEADQRRGTAGQRMWRLFDF